MPTTSSHDLKPNTYPQSSLMELLCFHSHYSVLLNITESQTLGMFKPNVMSTSKQPDVVHFLCEPVSLGSKQQHDCWWRVLGGAGVRIKLKPRQLYGNELLHSLVATNHNLEVLRSREYQRTQPCTVYFGSIQTVPKYNKGKIINCSGRFPHYLWWVPVYNTLYRQHFHLFWRGNTILWLKTTTIWRITLISH